jgi:hypothetical protein
MSDKLPLSPVLAFPRDHHYTLPSLLVGYRKGEEGCEISWIAEGRRGTCSRGGTALTDESQDHAVQVVEAVRARKERVSLLLWKVEVSRPVLRRKKEEEEERN